MLKNKRGFTLIELVMVIVILGILSAIAIPKFVNLTTEAKISATKSGLGAIRSVIAIEYAKSATGTSGAASFPSAITTDFFADERIPENKLNNFTAVYARDSLPSGTQTSGANGWWYISSSGKAGAYSDGDQDTSTW